MHLRHRSAAGGSEAFWYFDPVRRIVGVTLVSGAVAIDVCATKKPRYGAFPVIRVDACTWKIVPCRFIARDDHGELIAVTHEPAAAIGSETITLLDAPEGVSVELTELADE